MDRGIDFMFKFITALFLSALSAFGAGIPYLTEPTNSRVDTYIPQATGPNQKWVPYLNVTNAITNITLRPGSGVTIATNIVGVDFTIGSLWATNPATGGITNINALSGAFVDIADPNSQGPSGAMIISEGKGTRRLFVGVSNTVQVFRVDEKGDLGIIKNVGYTWPSTNAVTGQVLASTSSGLLYYTNVASGTGDSIWTNDLDGPSRIIRPIDQTRMVETFSIGTNNRALTAIVQDTNTAEHYTQGAYLENLTTNSSTRSLYDGNGSYGVIGEVFGDSGALMPGKDGVGVHGLADSGFGLQYGASGIAVAQYSGQTNVGVAGSALSGGSSTTTNVGVYAEVYNVAQGSAVQPNMVGSVFLGDSRNLYVPLLTLGTNGGTIKWQVNADGNLKQVNGAAAGSVMTSDANGVGTWQPSSSVGSNAVAVAAGTNITIVTNAGVATISATDTSTTNFNIINVSNYATMNTLFVTNLVVTNVNGVAITNFIRSIVGTGGVGPGTANRVAMFDSTTTNVTDSSLINSATNEVDMILTNSSYSTIVSNGWYGANTNSTGWRATVLSVDPAGYTRLDQLLGSGVNPATFPRAGMTFNGAWLINGYGSSATGDGGGKTPDFLPIGDNVHDVGSGSSRVRHFVAGELGYGATANTSAVNFGAGFGLGMHNTGIDFYNNTAAKTISFYGLTSSIGGYGFDLVTGFIAGGPANGSPDVFLHRPSLPAYGMWSLGTNNNSTTKARAAIISGPVSDDNAVNRAGGDLLLLGGPASGNGTNGNISLGTFIQSASGFGFGAIQTNRLTIVANPINLTTNSATTVATFTVPTSLTVVGGKFSATTEIKDASDVASLYEVFGFSAVNKAATVTATNSVPSISSYIATGSVGVTTTWTVTVSGTTVSIKCNAVTTGINATTARLVGARIELDSDGTSVVVFGNP